MPTVSISLSYLRPPSRQLNPSLVILPFLPYAACPTASAALLSDQYELPSQDLCRTISLTTITLSLSGLPQFVLPSRGPVKPTRRMRYLSTGLVPTTH